MTSEPLASGISMDLQDRIRDLEQTLRMNAAHWRKQRSVTASWNSDTTSSCRNSIR